ncbi:2251_t:CDS:2, partial [Acaulospora colombiana]
MTNPGTVKNLAESRAIFSYFNKIGPLLEFKFGRELVEHKKILKFGWVSYKDNEISAKLLSTETLSLPEPLSVDVKFEESIHEAVHHKPLPHRYRPRFTGFYINESNPKENIDASKILDLFSTPLSVSKENSSAKDTGTGEGETTVEELIEESIEDSETNHKSSSLSN